MHPSFGRYELLKRLAGGGMGEVYLARQRGLDGFSKLLVIKTLLPHLCEDEEFITMFKDEARLTGQLIHPNICQVFEFEQVESTYYIAMEYLRGDDLRRLFRACEQAGKPLRVPLICRIIADAAAGLAFAHALHDGEGRPYNIVHRDISPQNILVTFEGGVKVIDFGVAKAAGRAQHTRTGALKGKYSYMSPEQVAGKEIDGRTDIFALGVVLHELLTGRRLFKADSDVETLERVRQTRVPPPSSLNPNLPQSLDGIVLHALAQDPDQRFQTAQEFRLALEDWLIRGRMSASNAHLGEFLKGVYGERLEKESKLGPLLGDPGLEVLPEQLGGRGGPGGSPSRTSNPSMPATARTPSGRGTVNQRPNSTDGKSQIDLSQINTESGAAPFPQPKRNLGIAVGVIIAGLVATVVLLLRPNAPPAIAVTNLTIQSTPPGATLLVDDAPVGTTPSKPLALQEATAHVQLSLDGYQPIDAQLPLKAGAQQHNYKLEKLAPQTVNVQIKSDPEEADVSDGALLLGKTPYVWTTTRGEHKLTFSLSGYRELTQTVSVTSEKQDITVRLKKIAEAVQPHEAPPHEAPPQLHDIKGER